LLTSFRINQEFIVCLNLNKSLIRYYNLSELPKSNGKCQTIPSLQTFQLLNLNPPYGVKKISYHHR